MKSGSWQWLQRLPKMLTAPPAEPVERAQRIVAIQRNIILPARLVVIGVVFYMLYQSPWLILVVNSYGVIFETIQNTFMAYAFLIIAAAVLFSVVRRFPPGSVQWVVFIMGLGDGIFLGGLTILTNGFESTLYWVYPAVIILNAISIPLATPQIVLNLVLTILYLAAGLIETTTSANLSLEGYSLPKMPQQQKFFTNDITDLPRVANWLKTTPPPLVTNMWAALPDTLRARLSVPIPLEAEPELKANLATNWNRIFYPSPRYVMVRPKTTSESAAADPNEPQSDPYVLRVAVLVLLTFCCYGVQVLVAGQEKAQEEQEEFIVRTGQLRAAGRLAAEFAHQIKNPLAIINNVTFSLEKALRARPELAPQVAIIQEEVAKADLIITQIMGYAQLSEGRVEKLNVIDEMERAIQTVFPPGVLTNIRVHRNYGGSFPPLLMQRRHLAEAVSNLLQNARDVLKPGGNVFVEVKCLSDYSVEIVVRDDGGGIPPDKMERIFEAYYTTKEKGSGLGLAIVKHNVELYGGSVTVESELGKGAKFKLLFPAKSLIKLGK